MSTESLIIELDAKTSSLDSKLSSTDKKLSGLDKQVGKNDASFKKLGSVASVVATGVFAVATAALAAATAMSAVIISSAKSQRELANLSRQSKLSTQDFESLAFATEQYGINAEQIADISKDLSDKMGEFGKVGTGAFQDYADVVGLTKEEAKKAAIEFENMSSDQVLGQMVSKMEEAGVSGNEMTFALESMGNDLSRLIPLFKNGGSELSTLRARFNDVTESMKLSRGESAALQTTAQNFSLATDTLGKSGKLISSNLAPLLDTFFNSVIATVPTATQVIVDFINSFKTPEEIENLISIQNQIVDEENKLATAIENKNRLESKSLLYTGSITGIQQLKDLTWEIEGQVEIIKELKDREAELTKQRVEDAEKLAGGKISAIGGSGTSNTGDELQAILDRFKSEEQLLAEKYATELEMLEANNEDTLALTNEYYAKLKEIKDTAAEEDAQRESDLGELFDDVWKSDAKNTDDANSQKKASNANYYNAATTLANAAFEDNKAVKAGLVVVDTAAGISRAFAELPYPAALAASASIAATGIAQLAAITSASKGGGSSTSSVGSASSSYVEAEPTSNLSVSNSESDGSNQSFIIKFESGDNDALATALNGIMSQAKVNGAIS